MPGRVVPLVTGEYYHLINRATDDRNLFTRPLDFKRFLKAVYYYQYTGPKQRLSDYSPKTSLWVPKPENRLVEILAYTLMPNHFHILVRQIKDSGISAFMSQVQNSYTRRFNTKYKRKGPLFQGSFKSVLIESDEQLLHVSRYVHLNPVVAKLVENLEDWECSSYREYIGVKEGFCSKDKILDFFTSIQKYDAFLKDQIDYGQSLESIKHHLQD